MLIAPQTEEGVILYIFKHLLSNNTMRKAYLFLALALVFLSGCIQIEVVEKVNSNGVADIVEKVNYTPLVEQFSKRENAENMKQAVIQSLHNICEKKEAQANFTRGNISQYLTNCEVDEAHYTVTLTFSNVPVEELEQEFSTSSDLLYTYYQLAFPPMFKEDADMLSSAVDLDYYIAMPGEVYKAEKNGQPIGEIEGGRAHLTLKDLSGSSDERIIIKSKELNMATIAGGVLLILVVAVVLLRRK